MAIVMALMASAQSKVYYTSEITPESLVKIYKALGVEPTGRVAVKISTGEAGNNHYLKPTLIRNLVDEVGGTIVECCTAYGGSRQDVTKHWQTIHEHGFDSIFAVDIMDEFGQMCIPVKDRSHIKYDIVGDHLANYDWMINLAHFKGHAMGGYGGVLKNASIGGRIPRVDGCRCPGCTQLHGRSCHLHQRDEQHVGRLRLRWHAR